MPPQLPDRYRLEVRLGEDEDVEEWLATDTALDRPVLLRFVDTTAGRDRQDEFLALVRSAAAAPHTHMAAVYAAGDLDGSAYSISEWTGGMTLANRIRARERIPPEEFLPNASGLAEALSLVHAAGQVHGSIDPEAIQFSAAHPAKLGGWGRKRRWSSPAEDVRALAGALETTLTGREPGSVPPSEVVDRITPAVDRALSNARLALLDARGLADALRNAPLIKVQAKPKVGWSWRWVAPAVVLIVVAGILVSIGSSLIQSGSREFPSPTIVEATGPAESDTTLTTGTTLRQPTTPVVPSTVRILGATAYDPFGGDGEHDDLAARAIDGDFTSAWRTESYFDPLPLLKGGVGLAVEVSGPAEAVELSGVPAGTVFELRWAPQMAATLDQWTVVSSGTVRGALTAIEFPARDGGVWLVWFTDLPTNDEGTYSSALAEVRFRP
ncbi:MAG: hypothetical protein OEM66_02995 [Acidimicrobiia bacterium]|nr:hypothetical protein [Acidimicrobiia bacterium]